MDSIDDDDTDCWIIYVGPIRQGMTAMSIGPLSLEDATKARTVTPIIPVPESCAEYPGQVVQMTWHACLAAEPDKAQMEQFAAEAAGRG